MAALEGVVVTGEIVPTDSEDTYPLMSNEYIKGGFRSVQTKNDLYKIPMSHITDKSFIRVIDEENFYTFDKGINDWKIVTTGINNIKATYDNTEETLTLEASGQKTTIAYILDIIYPIGSIFISIGDVKPAFGEWEKLATGTTLWNDTNPNGRTIEAGLPNITGSTPMQGSSDGSSSGAFVDGARGYHASGNSSGRNYLNSISFNASRSSAIYGKSKTVQPPAIAVSMWRRIEPQSSEGSE